MAPRAVCISTNDHVVRWHRTNPCEYVYSTSPRYQISDTHDVCIELDLLNGPAGVLPDPSSECPRVIIRSSPLPMPMKDHMDNVPTRSRAFENCSSDDAEAALSCLLYGIFGHDSFREGQLESITELLRGNDSMVLLPTGAGKSLIYQFAGLCMPGKTLVVDPLVSLIEDQKASLAELGIDRVEGLTSYNSHLSKTADAFFVLVSPERLQREPFRNELTAHATTMPINLAVVDEAHCVSEWGHDFRTAYLNFGRLLRKTCNGSLGVPPLLALTGTASRAVLVDVMFQLGVDESGTEIIKPLSFDRKELRFQVVRETPATALSALKSQLTALPLRFRETYSSFYEPTGDTNTYSGIIFTTTVGGRRGIDKIRAVLDAEQLDYGCYSGRTPKSYHGESWETLKRKNAQAFKDNEDTIMLSTNSFGMGIDKPNVRWILHVGLPMSLEGYYQEVGRAGRNGQTAHCVLIMVEQDEQHNRRRLSGGAAINRTNRYDRNDDIDTALYFHKRSFPSPSKELQTVNTIYSLLKNGARDIPLESDEHKLREEHTERALHRLAVLGIVDDYTLSGYGKTAKASVDFRSLDAAVIEENLARYITRRLPGQATEISRELPADNPSTEMALESCAKYLIDFIYGTIEQARLRSLKEMWLVASQAADAPDEGGEQLRQRILEYLTEGDLTKTILELAESSLFSVQDWIAHWEQTVDVNSRVEWRAGAARLLSSYPDHPGLLISRGLMEGWLPDGDITEFETNLAKAFGQLARINLPAQDTQNLVMWLLAQSYATYSHQACIIKAAQQYSHSQFAATEWLSQSWHEDQSLSILYLHHSLQEFNRWMSSWGKSHHFSFTTEPYS